MQETTSREKDWIAALIQLQKQGVHGINGMKIGTLLAMFGIYQNQDTAFYRRTRERDKRLQRISQQSGVESNAVNGARVRAANRR